MTILSAVAEFERDLIVGAIKEGKKLGRHFSLTDEQVDTVIANLDCGISVSEVARSFKTSRQTIIRIRERRRQSVKLSMESAL